MALHEGTQLGPYEILTLIGAGGMGEVYKARDTRLDRIVAIKVLPEKVADREQLRERLSREAKSVSSLNHPNICALYDVGHQDGTDYLVMEFLEGETLAKRLDQGPLPLQDVIGFATQIADALSVAHKQGLIHRDLKPGNIMVTQGVAKLLDFGLAKSFDIGPQSSDVAATATSPLTAQGTIVGTFQYMAPEQLEGGAADARSDIFAFGAVLYEMATGRRAFEGKTQAGLIASIMKEAPRPLSEMAPMSPPALSRLVATCLEKDPEARRQTMNDVLLDLRWIAEGGSQAGVPVQVSRRRKTREAVLALVALIAIAAAATFGILWRGAAARPEVSVTSSLLPPPGALVYPDAGFALSPDGSQLAFVAGTESDESGLWLRDLSLDSSTAELIPGTAGVEFPFWSPDSRHIGFFSNGKLWRVDSRGGPTQSLAPSPNPRGGTWSSDGTIVFSASFRVGLERVPDTGGTPEPLTELDVARGESSHRWPWQLPDDRHVLFLSQTQEGGSADDKSRIEILDLDSGERRELFKANSSIQYASTGHILFWSQGAVYAQPFDLGSLGLSGDLFPVVDKVQYSVLEMAEFSVSNMGSLLYQRGEGVTGLTHLNWYDRSGEPGERITGRGIYFGPRFSHDGKKLTYELEGDIWVSDLQRGSATRLSFDTNQEFSPLWGPEDRWIYYGANRGTSGLIFRKQSSGLGAEEQVYELEAQELYPTDISSDGKSLLLGIHSDETDWDVWRLSLGDGTAEPLVQTPFFDADGRLSPDGEWLLYNSSESGFSEVYVVRLTGPGGRWQISTNRGWLPSWGPDGSEVLYVEPPETRLMSVAVELGQSFTAGLPELLLEAPLRPGNSYPYTMSPDGGRLVLNLRPEAVTTTAPFTLIQNWRASTISSR